MVPEKGKAYINASSNNTIVTITTVKGETLAWQSSGSIGFKGTKKGTPYAASEAAKKAADTLVRRGMKEIVQCIVKGIGPGRDPALRGLVSAGMVVRELVDKTPILFNGCRPPKQSKP